MSALRFNKKKNMSAKIMCEQAFSVPKPGQPEQEESKGQSIVNLGAIGNRLVQGQDLSLETSESEQIEIRHNAENYLFEILPKMDYASQRSSRQANASFAEIEKANEEKQQRLFGEPVRFGSDVQFRHVKTGMNLTSSKKSGKTLLLEPSGSANCWFRICPAFKISSFGDFVMADKAGIKVQLQAANFDEFGPNSFVCCFDQRLESPLDDPVGNEKISCSPLQEVSSTIERNLDGADCLGHCFEVGVYDISSNQGGGKNSMK